MTATATANRDEIELTKDPASTRIRFNGVNCGSARTTNTDLIKAVGRTTSQTLEINETNGRIVSGGSSFPELDIQLGGGTDHLVFMGSAAADRIILGTDGLQTDGDSDLDGTYATPLKSFLARGGNGDDVISAAGSAAAGDPFPRSVNIEGDGGTDVVTGGDGADTLGGDEDNSVGSATAVGDRVSGGDGADSVAGGTGNDVLKGDAGSGDQLLGDEGHDDLFGGTGADSLDGGTGDDLLEGQAGADTLGLGGIGILSENPDGADVVSGGGGGDSFWGYLGRTATVNVTLDQTANDGATNEKDSIQNDVERVQGGSGDDTLSAAAAPDVGGASQPFFDGYSLDGGPGTDQLIASRNGDDLFGGGGPGDSLTGGSGDDLLADGDSFGGPTVSAAGVNGDDTLLGSSGDDFMLGTEGGDFFSGGAGADRIHDSGPPNEPETFYGGAGFDTVNAYDNREVPVIVTINDVANDGQDVNGDRVAEEGDDFRSSVEAVTGGRGNDVLSANTGPANALALDNLFLGGSGNDTLSGGDGDDTLVGDGTFDPLSPAGNDTITGGNGEDGLFGGDGADGHFANDGGGSDFVDGGTNISGDPDGHTDTASLDSADTAINIP